MLIVVTSFLWCYAGVLLAGWLRAVARDDMRMHVSHVVSMLGVLVPVVSVFVLLIFAGGVLGIPFVVVILALIVPAGLVIAFQLELSRLVPSTWTREALRLAVASVLATAMVWWRVTP